MYRKSKISNPLLTERGRRIFLIFFEDWISIRKASEIYNPKLKNKKFSRKDNTVVRYKNRFKRREWINERKISKFGKGGGMEYRTNFKPYEDYLKGNKRMGRFHEPPTDSKRELFKKYKFELEKKEHRKRIVKSLSYKANRVFTIYDAIPMEISNIRFNPESIRRRKEKLEREFRKHRF